MIEEWTVDPAESPFNDCPVCCQLVDDCRCVECPKCNYMGSLIVGEMVFVTCNKCLGYGVIKKSEVTDAD
jgi:hypothetical protein